jgi:tryptophan-rich sensory protein
MGEIASQGQLRMSRLRWAIVVVPLIMLLGLASGRLSNSGLENPWYASLAKPDFTPPGWMFGLAWSVLYLLMGVALVLVLAARGARGRQAAIIAFVVQLVLNLAWPPLFFRAHEIGPALILIIALLVAATVTAALFWRVRRVAGLLLLPYLAWLCLALALNYQIDRMNPDGGALAPESGSTQIAI